MTTYKKMTRHSKIDDALSQLDAPQGGNGEVRYCDCAETQIDGERIPSPRFHDCQYCRARSTLVPTAVKITNEVAGSNNGGGHWTRVFADTMEELAKRCL